MKIYRIALVLGINILLGTLTSGCELLRGENKISCQGEGLKVPEVDVCCAAYFSFDDNLMTRFQENQFQNLEGLIMRLSFKNNQISEIEDGAFKGLHVLFDLDMTGNKLTKVRHAMFADMPILNTLILKDNQISDIEPNAFERLPILQSLNLNGNQLTEITAEMLGGIPELEAIHLQNNQLKVIHPGAFASLPLLWSVHLNNNPLTTLSKTIFAPEHPEILLIHLAQNKLTCDQKLCWLKEDWVTMYHFPTCSNGEYWSRVDLGC